MTPKPAPWLVTRVSHGTLGDRARPLRGTQAPGRQLGMPPQPLPPSCSPARLGTPSLAVPHSPSTPSPLPIPAQHGTLGNLASFGRGMQQPPRPGAGGLAGVWGPSSQGSTPCGLVTGSHKPSSRWLILVKPVVKMCPSRVKMARTGLSPSWGANLSWGEGDTVSKGMGRGEIGGGPDVSPETAAESYCSKLPERALPESAPGTRSVPGRARIGAGAGLEPPSRTRSQRPSCRSLIRLKPVVKILPSATKMARMGRVPSCGLVFSCAGVSGLNQTQRRAGPG